jgi:hypothetical protein
VPLAMTSAYEAWPELMGKLLFGWRVMAGGAQIVTVAVSLSIVRPQVLVARTQ